MEQPETNVDATAAPAQPGDRPPRSRLRRWARRLGLTILVVLVLLAAGHAWWGHRATARLESHLAAARAAGDPLTVEELNRWPAARGGSGENVVPVLRAAADAIDTDSERWRQFESSDPAVPLTDKEIEALTAAVSAHGHVLRAADEAGHCRAVDWQLNLTSPLANHLYSPTDLNGMRSLTRLLHADALLAHRRGDHDTSLRRAAQILGISRAVDHQPGVVSHLVAIGIAARAAAVATEVAPELRGDSTSRGRVTELAGQFLDERPPREGLRRALVGERVWQVDAIDAIVAGRMTDSGDAGVFRRYYARPHLLDNSAILASLTGRAIGVLDGGGRLHDFRREVSSHAAETERSPRRYFLAGMLIPSLDRVFVQHYRCIAEQRIAATCLAVRLYEADHGGRAPETLDELVPDYLPAVPLDPLVEQAAPLRYVSEHVDPQRPRVYSVGLNGADDGGRPPDPDLPTHVAEQTSDLVFFLKRQPRVFPATLPSEDETGDGAPAEPDEQRDDATEDKAAQEAGTNAETPRRGED